MNAVFIVLAFQALLGAFDNLWHHEFAARLPARPAARRELRLHAVRELLYGVLFLSLSWLSFAGAWTVLPAALLAVEVVVTCLDFLEEDRSRRLPPFERVLHTVLALSYGVLLGLIAPLLAAAAARPTGLALASHGAWSWFFTLGAALVLAWGVRNACASRRLAVVSAGPPRQPRPDGAVLVTGATGFIGVALVRGWLLEGRRVIVLARDAVQARATFGGTAWVVDRLDDIPPETRIDAMVHLAGAAVAGAPWTRARRRLLQDSRVGIARELLRLAQRMELAPRVLVAASAVGYYGVPSHDRVLDDHAPPQPGRFQSDLCAAAERAVLPAQSLGVRTVCLRFGLVLGRGGGVYAPLALAARLGLGAVMGHGRQPLPWIHRDDAIGLVRHAIAHPTLSGPVNAVAPELPRQADFARALARSCGRAVPWRIPAWLLRGALGELSDLLLEGQRAVPASALCSGYRFAFPRLHDALEALASLVNEDRPADRARIDRPA